ncbi:hypothetical protein EJ04DRAFT_440834 [Polyplosphaeria fusca]|uniref:Uncharacterized protein n=1 Tax=Polyplosphaeria fusca TaxID=682080 RepID=A0A9P4V0V1_9PLEO|nr:hypothetical protein EJ04DRAFT_440834 [Polyplosphaeria fusca]
MAKSTKTVSPEYTQTSHEKAETTRGWLARHLRLPGLRHAKGGGDPLETVTDNTRRRPQTAPSSGCATIVFSVPEMPPPPMLLSSRIPPPRPPRPDSGTIHDVGAWLDASIIKPAAPLMGGLPYWREGTAEGRAPSTDVRYATPIVREPERPATSHGQQIASFCRRAKRIQVRMPSLLRARSQRATVAQANRRSTSTPLLSIPPVPPKVAMEGQRGRLLNRSRSLAPISARTIRPRPSIPSGGWLASGLAEVNSTLDGMDHPLEGQRGGSVHSREQHVHMAPAKSTLRVSPAGHGLPREDSMGNLSDAPTYSSGVPPPSYRSRTASVLTISSFGCIDGISAERRQISHQRAVQRSRGVKGRFRKMAQMAHLTRGG